MKKLNRKILIFVTAFFIAAMLLTPFAVAKPGAEKSNEKFEYFELLVSGMPDTTTGITEETFIDEMVKTRHISGRGWSLGAFVELTVGEEIYTMTSAPYSVDYTTTFDSIAVFNNDGSSKRTAVKLVDVVTLYKDGEAIGTLVLKLESAIVPPSYSGTVNGYGTGALKGVKISGVDIGLINPPPSGIDMQFLRVGTITGWPL